MSTLILRANRTIKNPKYGKLPDLDSNLRFLLDARELQLNPGSIVNRWAASRGIGADYERNFTFKHGGIDYPTYSIVDGKKAVIFNGNSQLGNQNHDKYFASVSTYVVVAKANNHQAHAMSRILTGDAADSGNLSYYHSITHYGDQIEMITGHESAGNASQYRKSTSASPGWFVGVFVFDGSNSKMLTSDNDSIVYAPSLRSVGQDFIMLGSSPSYVSKSGSAFNGAISLVAQYERRFTEQEMRAAIDFYRNEFDI